VPDSSAAPHDPGAASPPRLMTATGGHQPLISRDDDRLDEPDDGAAADRDKNRRRRWTRVPQARRRPAGEDRGDAWTTLWSSAAKSFLGLYAGVPSWYGSEQSRTACRRCWLYHNEELTCSRSACRQKTAGGKRGHLRGGPHRKESLSPGHQRCRGEVLRIKLTPAAGFCDRRDRGGLQRRPAVQRESWAAGVDSGGRVSAKRWPGQTGIIWSWRRPKYR